MQRAEVVWTLEFCALESRPVQPCLGQNALPLWTSALHLHSEDILLGDLTCFAILIAPVNLLQVKDLFFKAKEQFLNVLRPIKILICEDI